MIVSSVYLLAFSQFLLDQSNLSLQQLFLSQRHLWVQLQTTHSLQLLQTQPASPPAAHSVQDEGADYVNLKHERWARSYCGVMLCRHLYSTKSLHFAGIHCTITELYRQKITFIVNKEIKVLFLIFWKKRNISLLWSCDHVTFCNIRSWCWNVEIKILNLFN